jgi:type III secretory pathway component EscR
MTTESGQEGSLSKEDEEQIDREIKEEIERQQRELKAKKEAQEREQQRLQEERARQQQTRATSRVTEERREASIESQPPSSAISESQYNALVGFLFTLNFIHSLPSIQLFPFCFFSVCFPINQRSEQ